MEVNRRSFLKSAGLVSGGIYLTKMEIFASLFTADPNFTMKNLRGDSGVFIEKGGTIGWMVSNKGIIVIDTQFPEEAGHLIKEIKAQNPNPVDILFNTHHHGDHTAGNIAFKGFASKIISQENSKVNQIQSAKSRGTESKQLYPDTTFRNSWSGKAGNEPVKAYYFGPAHTNGDSIIHIENDNIAHVGDLVFNRRFPYIDKSAGASIENWIQVLEKTRQTFDNDTLFIFGHALDPKAITGNKEDLKAMENYLSKLLVFMKKEIKNGKSLDELLKTTSIPGAEEWKGNGISRSINSAWQELKTES
ncbi:MAG: MBL fold metallo-hydrolase [Bacteroidetes bacterium]|nr:MAG: MBL fold metallo-hydrolase [Bacteroidota bacterium]